MKQRKILFYFVFIFLIFFSYYPKWIVKLFQGFFIRVSFNLLIAFFILNNINNNNIIIININNEIINNRKYFE